MTKVSGLRPAQVMAHKTIGAFLATAETAPTTAATSVVIASNGDAAADAAIALMPFLNPAGRVPDAAVASSTSVVETEVDVI